MKDVEIIGMLKSYVSATLVGMGALKGAPCQCVITENADGTHTVTMKWVDNEGDPHTDSFNVLNGQVGSMEDIANVQITSIADGQVLAWDSTLNKWVNTTNSATVASLENIGDIQFTSLADGEFLMWDDTAGKWVNEALGTAAKADTTSTVAEDSTDVLTSGGAFTALAGKVDKATTLAGYGISDAYTKTETDAAITAEIEKLDVSDSVEAGSYVTAVSEADGKISVTREAADVTPTANSTKMLTSGGAYEAFDNLNGQLGEIINVDECKNIAPNVEVSKTVGGINFVVNDDGSITFSGTATGNPSQLYNLPTTKLSDLGIDKSKTYIIDPKITSNAPAGVTLRTYLYDSSKTAIGSYLPIRNPYTLSFDTTYANAEYISLRLSVTKDSVVDAGTECKPLMCLKEVYDIDPSFVPYAKTNRKLTVDSVDWDDFSKASVVNFAPNEASTVDDATSGLTFTVNDDKSITISATSGTYPYTVPDNGNFYMFKQQTNKVQSGTYQLRGCPDGGSASAYRLEFYDHTVSKRAACYGAKGDLITVDSSHSNTWQITVYSGYEMTAPLTFKPMLTNPDYNGDYVPFAKTNRELTLEQGYCTEDQYTAIQTLLS